MFSLLNSITKVKILWLEYGENSVQKLLHVKNQKNIVWHLFLQYEETGSLMDGGKGHAECQSMPDMVDEAIKILLRSPRKIFYVFHNKWHEIQHNDKIYWSNEHILTKYSNRTLQLTYGNKNMYIFATSCQTLWMKQIFSTEYGFLVNLIFI
jgi:hypothetical protein